MSHTITASKSAANTKLTGVLKALATTTSKKGMTVSEMLATGEVTGSPSNPAASLYPVIRLAVGQDLVTELLLSKGSNGRGNRYKFVITPAGRKAAKAA